MANTTLSMKVQVQFAKKFRKFCEKNFLQIGKFTEHALTEMMEDYHFGMKAQKVLSQNQGKKLSHEDYLKEKD